MICSYLRLLIFVFLSARQLSWSAHSTRNANAPNTQIAAKVSLTAMPNPSANSGAEIDKNIKMMAV